MWFKRMVRKIVDRAGDEASWKVQLNKEDTLEEAAREYDLEKVWDREHWRLHLSQHKSLLNTAAFNRDFSL